jgi:hypothetical protein
VPRHRLGRIGLKWREENLLSDLIEFFLKTKAGPDTQVAPPYLVHFEMSPDSVPVLLARAGVLLPKLIKQGGFADGREAAEAAISDTLVNWTRVSNR